MTKKNTTPEATLIKTYNNIVNVLKCISRFCEESNADATFIFKRNQFEAFRNKGESVKEVIYYSGYSYEAKSFEDISFSTLRNYGVLDVVDIDFEMRCINRPNYWAEYLYQVNGEQLITASEYQTLKKIIPNCDETMNIEEVGYGRPVEVKIYTYSFNYDRIHELEEMAAALSKWAKKDN